MLFTCFLFSSERHSKHLASQEQPFFGKKEQSTKKTNIKSLLFGTKRVHIQRPRHHWLSRVSTSSNIYAQHRSKKKQIEISPEKAVIHQ